MSLPKRKCQTCKRTRPDTEAPCPRCVATLEIVSDGRELTTYPPTIIVGTNDGQTGHFGLVVAAPGATSETGLSPSGLFSIRLRGADGIGEYGEPRVRKILQQRFEMDGIAVVFQQGVNEDGEDGFILLDGLRYTLQITMALSRERIDWAAASTGTATASSYIGQVATWINEAIESKVPKTDPHKTILALDANHLGIIADVALGASYQERFGSPSARFGFAAVWLVGPTTERCLRLE